MSPESAILLDAAHPGERIGACRWSRTWKDFKFSFEGSGIKRLISRPQEGI